MRKSWIVFSAITLCACTIQQQNGNDLRLKPPPILADQTWQITGRETTRDGEPVCSVSAGEVEITWRGEETQVALSSHLNVGDSYKILVAGHLYETREQWFSQNDSARIVRDFLHSKIAYTEVQTLEIELTGQKYRRATNKLPLQSFAPAYRECKRYLSGE